MSKDNSKHIDVKKDLLGRSFFYLILVKRTFAIHPCSSADRV